jgi:PHD/YefM family antitoxin component YafN of YafNO toxin-antitoxin module
MLFLTHSMHIVQKTYSVRDLQRKYRTVIESVKRSHDAVVLMSGSSPEAVLLNVETYNHLVQDDYQWDVANTSRLVKEAEHSIKAKKEKHLDSWNDLDA